MNPNKKRSKGGKKERKNKKRKRKPKVSQFKSRVRMRKVREARRKKGLCLIEWKVKLEEEMMRAEMKRKPFLPQSG